MDISNLIIETTRECNLCCDHCMRGDAEDGVISLDHVHCLFQQIRSIDCITLTGGEPALHPNILIEILNAAKHYQIDIGNFYIATNGTIASEQFLITLIKWYAFCTDNENTSVLVSNDMYHDSDQIDQNWDTLSALRFVHKRNKDDYYDYKYHGYAGTESTLLAEGKSSNSNGRQIEPSPITISRSHDDLYIEDCDIYLNIHGTILNCCDLSYESQKKEKYILCHVNNFTSWAEKLCTKEEYA